MRLAISLHGSHRAMLWSFALSIFDFASLNRFVCLAVSLGELFQFD